MKIITQNNFQDGSFLLGHYQQVLKLLQQELIMSRSSDDQRSHSHFQRSHSHFQKGKKDQLF